MSGFEEEKGLVGKILRSTASESFDLANYTESRCRDLIDKSFRSPLKECTEMVKFTFTIGGGKLVRSRYDDSMSKWIISALKDIGFIEDRSAACDINSQGTFKQQHDTGQNLKTISIFPRVACANRKDAVEEPACNQSIIASQDSVIVEADFATFCEIVTAKTDSWSQRKRVLKIMQDAHLRFQELETKLVRGEMLSPQEQHFYDNNSGCDSEKINWIQGEVKALVDGGKLTEREKMNLLQSMDVNISALDAELESAIAASEQQKVFRLKEKREKMAARRVVVSQICPITHRLKKTSEIQKVYTALHNIHLLEDKSRSMSLTLADLKKIEPKYDLEQQLIQYQQMSRCWFESDEEFEERCDNESKAVAVRNPRKSSETGEGLAKAKKKPGVGGGSRAVGGGSAVSWSTRTAKSSGGGQRGGSRTTNPLSGSSGGFAEAFGSDSDSSEDS